MVAASHAYKRLKKLSLQSAEGLFVVCGSGESDSVMGMDNPYIALHREFKAAGAEVLLSSGQACVVFGIAAFSKDCDWIVRETEESCAAILGVLGKHGAHYRLGVPLHPDWLRLGLTSHFEFQSDAGFRMRTDFCTRPPRVPDIDRMWKRTIQVDNIDVVDVESLVQLKQTRRLRDYAMVGALAEVAGLQEDAAELALNYLQDYTLLSHAVQRWPQEAAACEREAVRNLLAGAARSEVVAALAIEQDARMQADEQRIDDMQARLGTYARDFARLRTGWRKSDLALAEQHHALMAAAETLLEVKS
jgi:hypothetical protein